MEYTPIGVTETPLLLFLSATASSYISSVSLDQGSVYTENAGKQKRNIHMQLDYAPGLAPIKAELHHGTVNELGLSTMYCKSCHHSKIILYSYVRQRLSARAYF